jgi:hypothetical protein
MTKRQRMKDMARIVEIRDAQRRNAEFELAAAQDAGREAESRRDEAEQRLTGDHRAWEDALSLPSLSLPLLDLWGKAIRDREAEVGHLAADTKAAADRVALCTQACSAGIARLGLARDVARECDRSWQRDDQEKVLMAFEDCARARAGRR